MTSLLKNIDHIGIAVRSIEKTAAFYAAHFSLEASEIVMLPEQGVKAAFISIGSCRLELLEPLDTGSLLQTFLDKRGESLHHIAFAADHLYDRIEQLKRDGVPLIHDIPVKGAWGNPITFLHPGSTHGVLIELIGEHG